MTSGRAYAQSATRGVSSSRSLSAMTTVAILGIFYRWRDYETLLAEADYIEGRPHER